MLDFSGWDLKKTLELFLTCNLSLNEHLQSPFAYRCDATFPKKLAAWIPEYFQPVKGMFHYFSSAVRNRELLEGSEPVKIKKLFYILRPLTACEWIGENGTMPPTEFVPHLNASSLSTETKATILSFVEAKKTTDERVPVGVSDDMRREILSLFAKMEERVTNASRRFGKRKTPGAEPLEALFRESVGL